MSKKLLFLAFLFAILFKGFFAFLIYRNQFVDFYSFFGSFSGDSEGYLLPVDRFWTSGKFYSEHRMPGYSIFYFMFTSIFDREVSLNLLVICQVILAGISSTLLAVLAFNWTKMLWVFFFTYVVIMLSTYISWYDGIILTESLTTSFLIFVIYTFSSFLNKNKSSVWMLIPGFLYAWLVFLRPVFFPIFIIFLIALILKYRSSYKNIFYSMLLFLVPFLLLDGLWIFSNYQRTQKIIPFQETFLGPTQSNVFYEPAFQFIQSWGGNYIWWKEGTHIRYFGVGTDSLEYFDKAAIRFPDYIYTSQFNFDSLKLMSDKLINLKILKSEDSELFQNESKSIYDSFEKYTNSIKQEKPLLYHIKAKISLIHQFLFTSKAMNPYYSIGFPFTDFIIKIKSMSYIITLVFGYLGAFFLFFRIKENHHYFIISGIIGYTFIIHPLILRVIENRYLLPSYPFLILAFSLALYEIIKIYRSEKI